MFCALHDQLASLGRHVQLMRCFSAVAELLVQIHTAVLTISQVYDSFPINSSPQKFLGIMLCVAFEERHFGPDSRQHLMRADNSPLAGPHHPQQCTQLISQTSVINNNTLDDIYLTANKPNRLQTDISSFSLI